MSLKHYIFLIKRIDQRIRMRATGSATEFAEYLGISPSRWYEIRKMLVEDLGFPIAYDRCNKTYYYTKPGRFYFDFEEESS